MSKDASASILYKQFRELTSPKTALPSFRIELHNDNIYDWRVGMMVLNRESIYYGGYFLAEMKFPRDFPFNPPTFRFLRPPYHPNIYHRDGLVCISILHPGTDAASGEADSERWTPAQSVESVLLSILSLLEDPNPDSPANIDAAVAWRNDKEKYMLHAKRCTENSKLDIPEDFVMPEADAVQTESPVKNDGLDEDNFWYEDQAEDDFDEDEDLAEEDEDADAESVDFADSEQEDEDMDESSGNKAASETPDRSNNVLNESESESPLSEVGKQQSVEAPLTPAPESEQINDTLEKFKANPKKHACPADI
ncbi:ubiquitin-conjugating enzyme/RWD-like protein [Lipomyces arxii]|uniref:ubiquitin-conjugating enzyme/RWD-like protein n=1 Tax=Lipomyces arxii TaxID=56418 RepID=UPI0034CE7C40